MQIKRAKEKEPKSFAEELNVWVSLLDLLALQPGVALTEYFSHFSIFFKTMEKSL